jgi:hypothetical protein
MPLEMVLNEASLASATDKESARQLMFVLSQTARQAVQMGIQRTLRGPEQLERMFLCPGYTFGDWSRDECVDIDLRRYIRSLSTRSPFWQNDPGLEENVRHRLFTLTDGREAVGLGVAALLKGLAISLRSNKDWEELEILVTILTETLTEDGESTTDEILCPVKHANHKDMVALHRDWITERLHIVLENGTELWHQRQTLFPNLLFCAGVQSQLEQMPDVMLQPVITRLTLLQSYCQDWVSGNFDPEQLGVRASTESQPTLERYGEKRTFICPDGIERLFDWHVRLTPLAWRIHFYPLSQTRQIVIGYVGKHLRTVRFH